MNRPIGKYYNRNKTAARKRQRELEKRRDAFNKLISWPPPKCAIGVYVEA